MKMKTAPMGWNSWDTVKFRCANVLDELPKLYEAGVIGKDY